MKRQSTSEVEQGQAESIPIEVHWTPTPRELEYSEFLKYESGEAEREAREVPGPHSEPWFNVLSLYEPGSRESLDQVLRDPGIASRIRGRVLDLGAGCCWAAARLSKEDSVEEVVAVDLSPRFLSTVGTRVIRASGGVSKKLKLCAASFESLPQPNESVDAVVMIAAIHHAIAPIRVLKEAKRVLRGDGILVVIESPEIPLRIHRRRELALRIWKESGATEIAYTRSEIEYLLRCGGFDLVRVKPVGPESPSAFRRTIRRVLRRLGLSSVVLADGLVFTAIPEPGARVSMDGERESR